MDLDLSKLMNQNQAVASGSAKLITYQILKGLYYIHSCGVVHGDLKPNCILLNSQMNVKLTNFRMSHEIDVIANISNFTTYELSYKPIEMMFKNNVNNFASDVWATGCILAELLFQNNLFYGHNNRDRLMKIFRFIGKPGVDELAHFSSKALMKWYISSISANEKDENDDITFDDKDELAIDLLYKMLAINPLERYSTRECLEHPYFDELREVDDNIFIKSDSKYDWDWYEDVSGY